MIRKRALPIALGAGVMLAFFLGCGGDNPTATPPPGTGPIIPPTTKIITDAEAENALLAVGSSGQLLVRGGSSLADRVATGDVLVSGRIPGAPYGLLRLVTAQRDSAGVRIIETAQAALTDAIQSCDVSDSLAFNQSHVDSIWTDEGVTLVPTQSDKGGLETEFAFDLDIVAYDLDGDRHTEDDQIKIHGRISFTGGVDWTLKFENWQPKVVQYGLHSSSVANLRATVGSRADACTYQKTLGTVYLGQYMVMIGPMPVAFDSQLDFVLKCRVSVSGEMTFGLDLQESRRNGSTYSNGSWRNYSQSSKTVNPLVPLFSGTVRGKIEVGTHCGVRLYGVAGPYVEGFAFADLSGTVATVSGGTSLSGQLDVGGIASLGFLLRIVSHTFLDYSADWTLFRLTVWQDQRSVVDPTPPAAVMNLAAGTPTTSSVPLTWTAPGDDNNTGTATEYDIRYSTSIITVGNWASATQATGEPTPQVAGTSQSFTVTGLSANTTYYFALKTRDEVPNWSALSNVPMVTIPASSSAYVLVSPGTFTMGSPDGETGRASDETNHQVVLTHSFFMQEHEVTNQEFVDLLQWAKAQGHVVVTASSVTDNLGSAQELLDLDGTYCEISYNATSGLFSTAKPNYPAKEVTWYGAAAYCDWLSLKNNLAAAYSHVTWQCGGTDPYSAPGYRLPTESEWEYACRAGNTAAFSNGAITQTGCNPPDPNLLLMGWFNCNAGGGTNPVAQKTANAFGIKDMHGNMWEFCNDWYSSTYPTGPVTNPVGPSTGTLRIRRGGSWLDAASVCRSASRYWGAPPTDSARNIGFRPVRSAN